MKNCDVEGVDIADLVTTIDFSAEPGVTDAAIGTC